MTFSALPGISVQFDESAEPLDTFLRYNIRRRLLGDSSDGIRIATITDRSFTTYFDDTVGSAVAYQYNVTVTSEVGGEEVEGDLVDWVTAQIEIHSVFIHSHRRPEVYGEFQIHAQSAAPEQDIAEVQVWGRSSPTAHIGPRLQQVASIQWRDTWYQGSEQWAAVEALMAAQAAGDMLVFRQHRGLRMFGTLHAPQRSDAPVLFDAGLTFRAKHFEERV